ncbi:TetR family transcriptional regulator [Streptomyces sp. AV19]|uniref:TetR/AcrR family transcriptional regulator n=1 Tax=Streptomyces sp. AV19 TaxID=2793068 RepID=UPI0018FF03FB|nr:TetR/AcrR family transcriptional regulator [Streptomyces sp. AV19]MBH1936394.1 TetR family transcriptional regulator [Streptomyces sp. AV19]MDG4532433.1 TetR family transcriptional regulator [Streptomyces sp. AV19]
MRAKSSEAKQESPPDRTFIEAARRAQIVAAAIEVIAEVGYAKATFTRIARRAGLSSTGMISYHFSGKDDLMREVVAEVMRVADGYMRPRIEAEATASGRLRAHIESNLALLAEFPRHLPAMVEVLSNIREDTPSMREFAAAMEDMNHSLVERIRLAQEAGEFREFNPETLVHALRGSIDSLVQRAARDPRFDAAAHGRELAEFFERATRRTP